MSSPNTLFRQSDSINQSFNEATELNFSERKMSPEQKRYITASHLTAVVLLIFELGVITVLILLFLGVFNESDNKKTEFPAKTIVSTNNTKIVF